jgi:PEP-CTERM motif
MPRLRSRSLLLSTLLALCVFTTASQRVTADPITQTFNLDQSNVLADGVLYGTVKVDAFKSLGEVTLTYTADPSPYSSVGKNFGFHTVGFNTDLALKSAQITAPAGWKLDPNANLSMFGVFSWKVTTSNKESPSVIVTIDGLGANATLDHFTLPSVGGESVIFAGHVIDFALKRSDTTSQWVGGSLDPPPPGAQGSPPQAPEPSTLALAAAGLCGCALLRFTRRLRQAARRIAACV